MGRTGRFTEISVNRINIVNEEGALRLAISNARRFPDPIIGGKAFVTGRRPSAGMIFFNDDGDECGGLVYNNGRAALLFDRYLQDEALGLTYGEKDGRRRYGIWAYDEPERPISEFVAGLERVRAMPGGHEKEAAEKELRAKFRQIGRFFAGKGLDGSVGIVLCDSQGRERVRIAVGPDDVPEIVVADSDARTIRNLRYGGVSGGREDGVV